MTRLPMVIAHCFPPSSDHQPTERGQVGLNGGQGIENCECITRIADARQSDAAPRGRRALRHAGRPTSRHPGTPTKARSSPWAHLGPLNRHRLSSLRSPRGVTIILDRQSLQHQRHGAHNPRRWRSIFGHSAVTRNRPPNGRILPSLTLGLDDEWSNAGLVGGRRRRFPPEPSRSGHR